MAERPRIRQATEADLTALSAMTREFNAYLNALGDGSPLPTAEDEVASAMDRLRSFAFGKRPLCTILMAELDGETVGYVNYFVAVLMDDVTLALYVADFYVRRHCRRRGVGTALMLEARRIAAELGASRLLWTVWDKNKEAMRFYEKLGAAPSDGEVLMHWRIAS